MPRHARAILAALCASVAAPATQPATPTVIRTSTFIGTANPSPPKAMMCLAPQGSVVRARGLREKYKTKEKLPEWLELYPLVGRGVVKLGGEHQVLAAGTRIKFQKELGCGSDSTVIGGEYATPNGELHTIGVKRMLTATPEDVLDLAMVECGLTIALRRGGVVPCYGVVVGPNLTEKWLASTEVLTQAQAERDVGTSGALVPPLAVGRWSDQRSNCWNVAQLVPWAEGAINGADFNDHRQYAQVAAASALHSALSVNNNWRLVPAAIVACVTRAAKLLAESHLWHRNIKPSSMLFMPDFAARPFAPENCVLFGFGFAADENSAMELDSTRNHMPKLAPGYLHPQALDWYPRVSAPLHHALDVFSFSALATELILGGVGHPVLRCMRNDARLRATSLRRSSDALERRRQVAARLAALSENDMRGMAVASAAVCDEIGNLVNFDGAIREDEARVTRSAFMERAKLFGWTSNREELVGDTPELVAVARLFGLTAGKTRPETLDGFVQVYKEILKEYYTSEGATTEGANGSAVKE